MAVPPSDPLAHATETRHRLLRYLRHGSATTWWRSMIDAGQEFALAPAWRSGTAAEQARHLAAAERDRIESGPLIVVDPEVMVALKPLFDDPTWQAVLSADLLPAPSGMLVFPTPVFDHRDAAIATFVWGPNHDDEPRQPLTLNGWVKPDKHTTFATGVPVPKDAPLVPVLALPLAFSPHLNWHLTDTMETADYTVVCARSVTALWYALACGAVTAWSTKAAKGPEAMVLELSEGAAVESVYAAIASAWDAHAATGGHTGGDDGAAVTAASGVYAVERDAQAPHSISALAQAYRDLTVKIALTESSASDRWPGVWSTLDRIIAADVAAKSSGAPESEWVSISVTGTAKTLVKKFDIDPNQARRYAPAIAGLAAWRSAGRHAIVLMADDVRPFAAVEDLAGSGKSAAVGPVPFLLMVSEPGHPTPTTLYYTSTEPTGPRFWALDLIGTRDHIDCLRPEWINLENEGTGRELDDEPGPDSPDGLVPRAGFNISIRMSMAPDQVIEVGELLGRRTAPVPWPTAPDPGCLTLWMGHNPKA
jgi:hypothetical protein